MFRKVKKLSKTNDDPIAVSQNLVRNIEKIVGINDVFGTDPRRVTKISYVCILAFACTFVYFGTFSQMVHLIKNVSDPVEVFKALNCLSATSVPLSKYIFMWTSREQLKNIFAMCRSGMGKIRKDSSAYQVFFSTLRKARRLCWLVIANQLFIHVVYLLYPVVLTIVYEKRYLPITPAEPYGLSPPLETPMFEITYVITTLATAFSAINQTGYITLFVIIIGHELGHFYVITETLTNLHKQLTSINLTTGTSQQQLQLTNEETRKSLLFCIKHHQFIADYHLVVKNAYKNIFGAHFFMMTVLLVTTLQTMQYWDFRNTILTGVTGLLPLILYCYGGELIITAGEEMVTALYSCGWDMMSPKNSRTVLLMLMRSQKPFLFMAADTFSMNHRTFSDVVQIVYKVYTVFNN